MFSTTDWTTLFDGFSNISREFFTSTVFASLAASLTGAFGGAWAAKRIAESTKRRDELLKEIRNTNSAVAMLYGIANAML